MTNTSPTDAELDELLDNALEEFTTPSQPAKSASNAAEPASTSQPTSQGLSTDKDFEEAMIRELTHGMEDLLKVTSEKDTAADEAQVRSMLDQLLKQIGSSETTESTQPASSSAEAPGDSKEPQSFQDKIKATMDKLKESADRADAETNDESGLGMMEELMRQLDQAGDDPQLDSLVDDVIGQLMSKDVLQQPLKDLDAEYPKYLEQNKDTLSKADYDRYKQQHDYIRQILALFEKSVDDKDPQVVELMQKMQECGQPPNELLKLLAPDMELDEKGEVKVPDVPNCTIM
ncbi:Peroxisome chaperone and import receptor [Coemansia sp. RSA 1290]|nr:Pex19 protein [Coemansia mojavensis]KAJ1741195.1 Peroxisome chaperone and import receptor [Coemansia sp. RSA 1086]KAJ1749446.1 Peroxisome chaperone and import receptor [Coemansia sp. RSA 1821]KAJ2627892.1 Peroxisome chaperone and import receptor [Coemansia sp. RSA 1290]KAJ2647643.1 Peroxisome chaperone and import receptor [Coemansia sp. RSA 1250]KAJ2669579.1 Peroxisome chaperone and import receptor [Coemansia sp. RSA 1085]